MRLPSIQFALHCSVFVNATWQMFTKYFVPFCNTVVVYTQKSKKGIQKKNWMQSISIQCNKKEVSHSLTRPNSFIFSVVFKKFTTMSIHRLEVRLKHPNPIFESWLQRWLSEAENKESKSQFKIRSALEALKMYPLPLPSGKECAILKGFGPALCRQIDQEIEKQNAKAKAISLDSSVYEKDLHQMIASLKKVQKKSKAIKLTKKQIKYNSKEEERLKQVTMSSGMFRVLLIVDTHETSGKNKKTLDQTRGYLESLNVQYEVRRLTVGDFLWIARDSESNELVLPYIVERKRMDDLASSIRDGRFHEQKHRLTQSGLQHIIYLVEDFGDNEHVGLPLNNLKQALVNSLVHNNFTIEHTENHRRSIMYLKDLTQTLTRLYKDKVLLSSDKEDLKVIHPNQRMVGLLKYKALYDDSARNAQLTIREVFVQQLLQLHSLSLEKSLAIVSLYPTPRCLLAAYDNSASINEARNLLTNLTYGQMERPLGEKISRTIYDFYRTDF